VTTEDAARRWTETWERGWREHDVDAIVALYADEALHRSAPFRDPGRGPGGVRAYVEWAFSDEERADVWFGEPIVAGDRTAVTWWAVSETGSGEETLAGVSVIRFDADGLVAVQDDYWNMEPGRHEPHEELDR
jgi:ketosteroid isomerase-like protein